LEPLSERQAPAEAQHHEDNGGQPIPWLMRTILALTQLPPAFRSAPAPHVRAGSILAEPEIKVSDSSASDNFHSTLLTTSPTLRQRQAALVVVVLQFVACAVVAPFPAHLPRIDSFVPVILAIIFVADFMTAVLLFSHTTIVASRAILILANGYLFSALIVIPHALTFPGAFAPEGLLGGIQSSAWLNIFWHLGFLAAVAGYASLKDGKPRSDAVSTSAPAAFFLSLAIQIGVVCALTWGVTAGDRYMPRLFLSDLTYAPLVHYAAGALVLISVFVLLLMWTRRTSVLDLWVMVTICMLISEMALVTLGMTARFYLGWYVTRTLAVAVSTVVLVALLAEAMRLNVEVLKANILFRRERDHTNLLISELDHRVKNVLASVSAIALRTQESSRTMDEFVAALNGRIKSMASTHELLSHGRWQGVPLAELIRGELAPYATAGNTRIDGPDVILNGEAAQALALVFHELATNAAKYGALSIKSGRVTVRWSFTADGREESPLCIEWEETGGPQVVPPTRSGLGTGIIHELIPYELGGNVEHVYRSEGIRCKLEIPATWLSPGKYGSSSSLVVRVPPRPVSREQAI
jgi:two-component sensor histidine kinase